MKPRSTIRCSILASFMLGAATISHAQTWTGTTNASWNTSTNWLPTGVPAANAAITFDGTGTNFTTNTNARFTLDSITFSSGQTTAVTINTTASSSGFTTGTGIRFNAGTNISVAAGAHKIVGTGANSGTSYDVIFNGAANSTHTFDIVGGASFEIQGRVFSTTSNIKTYSKTGDGTLIFSGLNGGASSWTIDSTKSFQIQQGTLRFANSNATGLSGNSYTVSSGAAIELSGGFVQTLNNGVITLDGTGVGGAGAIRSISGDNTIAQTSGTSTIVLNTASSIGVHADSLTISKIISGANTFSKVGAGTLTLSAANTFSGGTTVSAGTLTLKNNLALQNSALVTTSAGTVTLDPLVTAPTIGGLSGATGDLATVLSSGYSGVTALTLNPGSGSSVTYGGVIADGVAGMTLTKSGSGTQILTGINSYTGTTTLSAGTLSIGTTANLGAAASNLVFNGGTLQITGTALGSISGIGHAVSFTAAKNVGLDISDSGHTFTVDQVLDQTTGIFTKFGAGTAILNQANTHTGTTEVSGGTLVLANVNAVQNSTAVRISTTAGPGIVQLSTDTAVTPFGITGSSNNPGTLVSDRATTGPGITHALGSANLGANTYSFIAGTHATGGTAAISLASMTLGAGASGTTVLNPTTAALTIVGPVTLINASGKILNLGGTNTGNSIGGAVADSVTPVRTVALIKSDTGTWALNGSNTYSGDTTVSAGILTLSMSNGIDLLNANTANDLSTVTIASTGATLNLTYAGTDVVDKLFIGTTQMAAGTYGPSASPLAQITGSGTLTVATGPTALTYASWASSQVPPVTGGPGGDDDNDGVKNLVEYALADGQERGTLSGNTLSFTKRGAPYGSDLTYSIQQSTDLGSLVPWTEVSGGSYVNNATTISYTLTPPAPVKNFIRLKVTQAP